MRLSTAIAACLLSIAATGAKAATEIDLYFPAPAEGRLTATMQRLVDAFNHEHPDVHATAVYTGGYYETNSRLQSAIDNHRPPAVAIVKTDFVRGFIADGSIAPLEAMAARDGQTADQFMDQFWPALKASAMDSGHLYAVPFHLATPLLYYSVDAFKDAGLDPDHPPATWPEWIAAAKKLTKQSGDAVTRWGVMMPQSADWCGWILSALAMSDGGEFYDTHFGGAVYYTEPSTIGAVRFLDSLVHRSRVMPEGVMDPLAVTSAFFDGHAGMIVMSSESLPLIKENMKTAFRTAFLPRALTNAAPFTGAAMVVPEGNSPERKAAAWALVKFLSSPAIAGEWSRASGFIAPVPAAYDLPEMQAYLKLNPEIKVSVDQAAYGRGWYSSVRATGVRAVLEDGVQAVLSGKATPAAAMQKAQQEADALMRPYVEKAVLNVSE